MSPDYPPQTIVDSPRKGRYLFVRTEPGPAQLSLSTIFANWPLVLHHFRFFSFLFFFALFCAALCVFFRFKRNIDSKHKRTARVEGSFCESSPLTVLVSESDPRGPRKAKVVSRLAFVISTWNLIFQMCWILRLILLGDFRINFWNSSFEYKF